MASHCRCQRGKRFPAISEPTKPSWRLEALRQASTHQQPESHDRSHLEQSCSRTVFSTEHQRCGGTRYFSLWQSILSTFSNRAPTTQLPVSVGINTAFSVLPRRREQKITATTGISSATTSICSISSASGFSSTTPKTTKETQHRMTYQSEKEPVESSAHQNLANMMRSFCKISNWQKNIMTNLRNEFVDVELFPVTDTDFTDLGVFSYFFRMVQVPGTALDHCRHGPNTCKTNS